MKRLFFFFCCILWYSGYSQDEVSTPLDSTQRSEIKAIETTQLTEEAQRANKIINDNKRWLSSDRELSKINLELDALNQKISGLEKTFQEFAYDGISSRAISEIKSTWQREATNSEKIQNRIKEEQKAFDRSIVKLEKEKLKWGLTQDVLSESEETPKRIIEIAKNVISGLEEGIDNLKDSSREVLIYVEGITQAQLLIEERITELTEQEAQNLSNLFAKTHDSYFKALTAEKKDSSKSTGELIELWKYSFEDTVTFIKSNKNAAFGHFVLTVIIFLLLLFASKKAEAWKVLELEGSDTLHKLLSKPLAISIFISLFLSFFIFSNIPINMVDFIFVLVLINFLWFLPIIFSKEFQPTVYLLAFVFFLDQVQNMMVGQMLAQRTILLFESLAVVVGFALIFYIRRNEMKLFAQKSFLSSLTIYTIQLMGLLHIVSLYANFSGMLSLTAYINRATLKTAVAGLVLYTIFVIFKGIWAMLVYGKSLQFSYLIKSYKTEIYAGGKTLIKYCTIYLFFTTSLTQFKLRDMTNAAFNDFLEFSIRVGNSEILVSNVVGFFLVLIVSYYLANLLRVIFEEEILNRLNLGRGVPMAAALIIKYTILVIGFFLAVSAAGIDLEKFGFIAGALGVGIGFGLQHVVGNFVAGLVLIFERPIHVGDVIIMGNLEGTVTQIGIRASNIRTYDGAEIIIPNGDFISKQVTNWTLSDKKRRIEQLLDIKSTNEPQRVMEVLKKAIEQNENVLLDPSPLIIFQGLKENKHQYRLLFWVTGNMLSTRTAVSLNINQKLKEEGIELAVNKTEVKLDGKQ